MSTNALTAHYVESSETSAGDAFVNAFCICLLLMALPVRNSAYLIPPIFVAVQALSGNGAFVRRTLMWLCIAICLSTIAVMIDSFYGQTVNVPGLMFGLLTYAPLAVIFGLRADFTIQPARRQQLKMVVVWFVIVQSMLGMLQFAASGKSDTVCGTFGLLDFYRGPSIGQVYLTFNLFAMIMFLLTDMRGVLAKIAVVLGLVTCSLAHSGHQTLFFIASLALVGMLQLRLKDAMKLALILCVLLGLIATLWSINWETAQNWYEYTAQNEDSPKQMAYRAALEIMSSPKNLLLGVGMGQFGSRAALISSGEYLSIPLPQAFIGESEYYDKFMQQALLEHAQHGQGSAISQPFCSALNVIVEFGLPVTALLFVAMAIQFLANRRLTRSIDANSQAVGMFANVGLVFFFLCCFIENYVEFPQAIFLPTLLYVAARASATGEMHRSVSTRGEARSAAGGAHG